MPLEFKPYTKNLGPDYDKIVLPCAVRTPGDIKRDFDVNALWDPGSNMTLISRRLAKLMNLKPILTVKSHSTQGETISPVYKVDIWLPNGAGTPGVEVVEGADYQEDLIIGTDIIRLFDYACTHAEDGDVIFSMVCPPLRCPIDFTKSKG